MRTFFAVIAAVAFTGFAQAQESFEPNLPSPTTLGLADEVLCEDGSCALCGQTTRKIIDGDSAASFQNISLSEKQTVVLNAMAMGENPSRSLSLNKQRGNITGDIDHAAINIVAFGDATMTSPAAAALTHFTSEGMDVTTEMSADGATRYIRIAPQDGGAATLITISSDVS